MARLTETVPEQLDFTALRMLDDHHRETTGRDPPPAQS